MIVRSQRHRLLLQALREMRSAKGVCTSSDPKEEESRSPVAESDLTTESGPTASRREEILQTLELLDIQLLHRDRQPKGAFRGGTTGKPPEDRARTQTGPTVLG